MDRLREVNLAVKTAISFMALAATTLLLLGLYKISTTDIVYGQPTVTTTNEDDTFTAQMTAVSKAGTLPIHQSHQTVKVLPARDDRKVWVGTISWASSKPVELELWHRYNSSIGADTEHGQPVTAPLSPRVHVRLPHHETQHSSLFGKNPL